MGSSEVRLGWVAALLLMTQVANPTAADPNYKTTLQVTPASRPDGGTFHGSGLTTCDQTEMYLEFYDYSGQFAYISVLVTAGTTRDSNGFFAYAASIKVPATAAPGRAAMFSGPECGDPNAEPSDKVQLSITKATESLRFSPTPAQPSEPLRLTGANCYGNSSGHVTIHFSGLRTDSVPAAVTGSAFELSLNAPATTGTLTASPDPSDCPGSTATAATVNVQAPPPPSTPPPTPPSATPTPAPSNLPSPNSSAPEPQPSLTTSPSPSPPQTITVARSSGSGARLPLIAIGCGLITLIGGLLAVRSRRGGL